MINRKALAATAVTLTLDVIAAWSVTALPGTPRHASEPASVVVLDVTGSLMTDVGMITGDLTVRVAGTSVTAQYRDAAEWYVASRCATEDSTACVWIGTEQGNRTGAIVINSRTE